MKLNRVILVVTLLVVAGLGFWFSVARWDNASKVASVLSALAGLAAVGVALWAGLRGPSVPHKISVTDTGRAVAGTGDANTGVRAKAVPPGLSLDIKNTGHAKSQGGNANTGLHLDQ